MSLRPSHDQPPTVAIVPDSFDATDGAETPFGKRWGGQIIHLSSDHLAALAAGQTLVLDAQNEYVVFLKTAGPEGLRHGG